MAPNHRHWKRVAGQMNANWHQKSARCRSPGWKQCEGDIRPVVDGNHDADAGGDRQDALSGLEQHPAGGAPLPDLDRIDPGAHRGRDPGQSILGEQWRGLGNELKMRLSPHDNSLSRRTPVRGDAVGAGSVTRTDVGHNNAAPEKVRKRG